jgi:hypothetical protein
MSAPVYAVTLLVERDGETLWRVPVDPLCVHLSATLEGRRAYIAHVDGCSCGMPPILKEPRATTEAPVIEG